MKKWLKYLIIPLVIIAIIYVYGRYIETSMLITKEYKINSSIIPDSYDGIKIVHFSDLHYGRDISKKKITKIINEINLINPDIVLFTGDLVEYPNKLTKEELTYLQESLNKINSKINKYAILGNHDYEYGTEKIKTILNNSNFIILQNNYDIIYNNSNEKIIIYGIDDVLKGKAEFTKNEEISDDTYKIVLVHEPDYIDTILEKDNTVNLILSGHSHNGQITLPFIEKFYTPKGSEKYFKNYYKKNNTDIYISSGLGTSKITFRMFNPPSINFYRINKEN